MQGATPLPYTLSHGGATFCLAPSQLLPASQRATDRALGAISPCMRHHCILGGSYLLPCLLPITHTSSGTRAPPVPSDMGPRWLPSRGTTACVLACEVCLTGIFQSLRPPLTPWPAVVMSCHIMAPPSPLSGLHNINGASTTASPSPNQSAFHPGLP